MSEPLFATLHSAWASAFQASNRLLKLKLGGPAVSLADKLLVSCFNGKEQISECFEYTLELLSDDTHIELKSLLGAPATLQLLTDQSGHESAGSLWQVSDTHYRTFSGIVQNVKQLGSDGGFSKYAVTIVPALKLLDLRRNSRVFQDKTVPQIAELIFKEHQANNPLLQWQFNLSETHSPRSYCVQYRESDLDFVHRLLREEGLYYHFEQPEQGETGQHMLVITDDHYSLAPNAASTIRFHRNNATEFSDSITEWQANRTLKTGSVTLASYDYKTAQTVASNEPTNHDHGAAATPLAAGLESYDPQTAYYGSGQDDLDRYTRLRIEAQEAAAKIFSGSGSVRNLIPGTWFELEQHPVHDSDPAEQRQFVLLSVEHQAVNNLGPDLAKDLAYLLRAPASQDKIDHQDGMYSNKFTTLRRGIPYRPVYSETEYAKPTAPGIQTATVVGPQGEEIYTDNLGRIKVQFHWQRPQDHNRDITGSSADNDEMSACWIRVASSMAGQNYGELFLPRIGQEVLINFIEGDIDRPVVTGRLYNGSQTPPTFSNTGSLPNNKTLSGIKTKTYKGNGYNELLFDDTPQEERTKLSTEHAKTQLNIGYLIHPRTEGKGQPRGEGFELRTDAWGAIRAGQGMLISTDGKANATSTHLDSIEATRQLEASLKLSKAQSEQATGHNAEALNANQSSEHLLKVAQATHKQSGSTGETQEVPAYSEPILMFSSPAGMIHATSKSTTIANGENLHLTQGQDLNIATGRSMAASIMQSMSWFVAGMDSKTKQVISSAIKLFSGKGKVEIQAQSNSIELTAQKDIKILSTQQKIEIAASKVITLTAGGAYIKLAGGNVDIHAPGKVSIKGGMKVFSGPDSMSYAIPELPSYGSISSLRWQALSPETGRPIAGIAYQIIKDGQVIKEGASSQDGRTDRYFSDTWGDSAKVLLGAGEWTFYDPEQASVNEK